MYEGVFAELWDQAEAFRRVGGMVALRFPDPEGRRDASGRVIPHDFVLIGSWGDGISSFAEGRERLWQEVGEEFGQIWDKPEP